jgi:hypothetical protein
MLFDLMLRNLKEISKIFVFSVIYLLLHSTLSTSNREILH